MYKPPSEEAVSIVKMIEFSNPPESDKEVFLTSMAIAIDTIKNKAIEEERNSWRNRLEELFLEYRGIYNKDDACKSCHGSGIVSYGSTSTWRGGIGGCAMTNDICDKCWGSGSITRKGINLRVLFNAQSHYRESLKLCIAALYEAVEIAPLDRLPTKAGNAIQQAQYVLEHCFKEEEEK